MKKPFIVANWKMNPETLIEAKEIASFSDNENVVVCPPFIFIESVKDNLKKATLGAQNCFYEKKGPFTGEVSSKMLREMGCGYVIVGHSERKENFNEEKEIINKKIKSLIEEEIIPIVCLSEKGFSDEGLEYLEKEIEVLDDIPIDKVIIAYEPVCAIGTGDSYPVDLAKEKKVFIADIIKKKNKANTLPTIFYGGSVDSENALLYMEEGGFSGLLVSTSSLIKKEFEKIINKTISI